VRRTATEATGHPPCATPAPVRLGRGPATTLHYGLGDGTRTEAWAAVRALVRHLGPTAGKGTTTPPASTA
jgi:hypothetical protein